jgi:hypothetical protein
MSSFPILSWADEVHGNYGPGVSRPKDGERTKEFRIRVVIPGSKPLTWITQAPSQKEALKYAKNRWPLATCSILK